MQKFTFFLIILLSIKGEAQCPNGNILFESQGQIDQFIVEYPECYELNGDVLIIDKVYNLNSLINIVSIEGTLEITNNDSLSSLSGLNNLVSIGGSLLISWNRQGFETLIGLDKLSNIGGHLYIETTSKLKSLEGLNNLSQIGGSFALSACFDLVDTRDLESLTSIGGSLQIYYNDSLKTLTGLKKITTIEGGLFISRNLSLVNLQGLKKIKSIDGGLHISDNATLEKLSGLESIDPFSIYKLDLFDNPKLSDCDMKPICKVLDILPSNKINIENNNAGCNSQAEIEASCLALNTVNLENDLHSIFVYPNPSSDIIKVDVRTNTSYSIKDISGKIYLQGQILKNKVIDISYLNAGVYFITFEGGTTIRIIKV